MKTTIQTLRKHAKNPEQIDAGKNNNEPVFYYFGELLREDFCSDILRNMHYTGWFTNEHGETFKDGSGLARGIVITLPARPGFPDGVFMAGYFWGDNEERVIWPECYADREECARMSDEHARIFADDQREHDIKWNAAIELENEIEDSLQRLRECIALRHKSCMDYVRDEISRLIESIRDKRETLATDYQGVL